MLLSMLTDDVHVVAIASDPEVLVEQIRRHSADLVIVEPRLPRAMWVIKAVRERVRRRQDRSFDGRGGCPGGRRGDAARRDAYLSKKIEPDYLISALRVVRAGRVVVSHFGVAALVAGPGSGPRGLTVQERELLQLIIEGLDNSEMAKRLAVSESTLKRNINLVLKKLDARNRIQAAVHAASNGLL